MKKTYTDYSGRFKNKVDRAKKINGKRYIITETAFIRGFLAPLLKGYTLTESVDGMYRINKQNGDLLFIRIGSDVVDGLKKEAI